MRFAFRLSLTGVMLVVLFFTLHMAEREGRQRMTQELAAKALVPHPRSIEDYPFQLPFQYNARIQDLIGFQWPAFELADNVAEIPELHYWRTGPAPLKATGYLALAISVGGYWFLVGLWLDKRFLPARSPSHSQMVRILFKTAIIPVALYLVVFLGKDLLRGWPEGPHGAYGATAWLAMAFMMLLLEIRSPRKIADSGAGSGPPRGAEES
jgi:hypothetical protein